LYHNWQFIGEAVKNGLVGGGGDNGGAFGPFPNRASNHGTGMAFRDFFYTATPMSSPQVETLRSAWLQNEESYVDPNPLCIGAACKYYECDALSTAIISATPFAYYPWRNGYDDVSTVDPNPLANGDLVYDQAGSHDLTMQVGGGTAWDPAAAGLLDTCGGICTSIFSTTQRSQPVTDWPETGSGTIVGVWDDPNDGGGNIQLNWNNQNAGLHASGVDAFFSTPTGGVQNINGTNIAVIPNTTATTRFCIMVWEDNGDNTSTVTFYDYTGLPTLTVQRNGVMGGTGSGDANFVENNFYLSNRALDNAIFSYAFTPAQAAAMADAAMQNIIGYVDPNENCVP